MPGVHNCLSELLVDSLGLLLSVTWGREAVAILDIFQHQMEHFGLVARVLHRHVGILLEIVLDECEVAVRPCTTTGEDVVEKFEFGVRDLVIHRDQPTSATRQPTHRFDSLASSLLQRATEIHVCDEAVELIKQYDVLTDILSY